VPVKFIYSNCIISEMPAVGEQEKHLTRQSRDFTALRRPSGLAFEDRPFWATQPQTAPSLRPPSGALPGFIRPPLKYPAANLAPAGLVP
jgi:hypothetical protein